MLTWFDPVDIVETPRYALMGRLMTEAQWVVLLSSAGAVQLVGLGSRSVPGVLAQSHALRLLGAMGQGFFYLCVVLSVVTHGLREVPGVSAYVACGAVQLLAVLYHTAALVRGSDPEEGAWRRTGRG